MVKVSKPVVWGLPVFTLLALFAFWVLTQKQAGRPVPSNPAAQPSPADNWLRQLDSADPAERRQAVERLGEPGLDGKAVVAALVRALKDDDQEARCLAAGSLLRIGQKKDQAVPVLVQAFKDSATNFAVSRQLVKLGPAGVPVLVVAVRDPQPEFRKQAAELLGEIGPEARAAAVPLIGRLKDKETPVRQEAARALGRIGAAEAVGPLIEALADRDLVVVAGEALGQIGGPAVVPLVAALKDPKKPARWAVARSLSLFGPKGKQAEPVLLACLDAEDRPLREESARALVWIGGDLKPALPVLFQSLQDRQFRWDAIAALVRAGAPAVPVMVQALKDPDEVVRSDIARGLGQIGPSAAKESVPALALALKDPDKSVRREAVAALGRIGQPAKDAIPAMLALLKDPDALNRGEVAIALARLGPTAAPAAPGLIANLADQDQNVHQETVKALAAIGQPAVPALKEALGHEDESIRRAAGEVLKQIK